jgi:hypothetical protein
VGRYPFKALELISKSDRDAVTAELYLGLVYLADKDA